MKVKYSYKNNILIGFNNFSYGDNNIILGNNNNIIGNDNIIIGHNITLKGNNLRYTHQILYDTTSKLLNEYLPEEICLMILNIL